MNIVVIGFGWVGQANALALKIMGENVSFYDPKPPSFHYADKYSSVYSKISLLKYPLEVDSPNTTYIVCVGDRVSPDGEQDISLIKNALNSLKKAKGTVVLRSTILPMSLNELKFDFYMPEFLHEKKAVVECINPHFFVVGQKSINKQWPSFFKKWQRNAYKTFIGTPEESSYIKYLSNLWNSVRIAFVNEFGDAMREPVSPSDVSSIEKVVDFVFGGKFYLRYGKAFGGHCLPKDTRAFFKSHKDRGLELPLISGAYSANEIHEKIQEKYKMLPEWYSAWQQTEVSGRIAVASIMKILYRKTIGRVLNLFK